LGTWSTGQKKRKRKKKEIKKNIVTHQKLK